MLLQLQLNLTRVHVPLSRFEFERIDLAITSLLANQPAASKSERARDQRQSSAVTPLVNLSCSFLPRVSRHLIYFITTGQVTVLHSSRYTTSNSLSRSKIIDYAFSNGKSVTIQFVIVDFYTHYTNAEAT